MVGKLVLMLSATGTIAAAGERVIVQQAMLAMAAPSQVLADLSAQAMDDDGKPAPAKLSAADWTKLAGAARTLKTQADRLATTGPIAAAAPGAKLQNEGGPGGTTAAQVEGFIAADRAGFAAQAKAFSAAAEKVAVAATAHDAATVIDTAGALDEACTACHGTYWYPSQS